VKEKEAKDFWWKINDRGVAHNFLFKSQQKREAWDSLKYSVWRNPRTIRIAFKWLRERAISRECHLPD